MDYLQFQELYHHGIKGQKWGIRRYQNDDGTFTEEGKARYGYDISTKKMTKEGKKQYKQDAKNQNKIDHPTKEAIKSGIKTGLGVSALGVLTTVGGVSMASIGNKTNSTGAIITGYLVAEHGAAIIASGGIFGIIKGAFELNKNNKLSGDKNNYVKT